MRNLVGKRALITGAASGIGRAIALEFARSGTHLVLVDRDESGLTNVVAEARSFAVDVTAIKCDVAQIEQLRLVVDQLCARWRGVDILVNNAGVTYYGPSAEMRSELWDAILDVNLRAPLRLTSMLLPTLLARPEAHVLNVCSALGLIAMPRVAAYCTSKFGLVGYSESLRAEYGRLGLGVTALCPGFVATNLFQNAVGPTANTNAKTPPKWVCTTPERVAIAAVRAVRSNRGLVVVEPIARTMYAAKRFVPGLLDFLQSIGRRKRVAAKQLVWEPASDQSSQSHTADPPRRAA